VAVAPPTANFVTSVTPGTILRNDIGGAVGVQITVGAQPITVTALGRYVVAGNSQKHTMTIVDVFATDHVLGTAIVDTSTGTPGKFRLCEPAEPRPARGGPGLRDYEL
jgi:hypothetical protein